MDLMMNILQGQLLIEVSKLANYTWLNWLADLQIFYNILGSTVAVKCFNPNSPMSTAKGVNSSPRKLESFSDWLHSESYHLKQEGHSYHVSDSQKDSTRKSVRFNTGNKHGTGSSISSESDIDFPLPPPDSLQILSDSKYPPYNHKLGSLV